MSHGTPDWGRTNAALNVYQVNDLGEAVVRLGSIVSHDRRGDVVFLEDFEAGLNRWQLSFSGTGAAAAISTARFRGGGNSVLLTSGSTVNLSSAIRHSSPFRTLGNFGVESSFNLPQAIDSFQMKVLVVTDNVLLFAGVEYDSPAGQLQYLDSTGTWVSAATVPQVTSADTMFTTLKFVVDPVAQKYVRLLLNEVEIDMAGVGVQVGSTSSPNSILTTLTLFGRSGQNDELHVDDFILTQNEPA